MGTARQVCAQHTESFLRAALSIRDMGARIRLWLAITFAAAVLLLCFVGALAYRTTTQLIVSNEHVTRSHGLLERLTYLRVLLDDAETGSRGYALTGRKDSLEPYNGAVAQLNSTIQILRHDLAENPESLRRFEELPPLIESRLAVMRELIAAREAGGFSAAAQVAASGRGKELMNALWAKITRLQVEEQNVLLKRDRELRESARRAIWAVLIASLLGVIVLAAATTVIYRTVRQRELAEAALRRSESVQRAILDGTNHAVMSTDGDGLLKTVNVTGLSWLGYEINELAGKPICVLHDQAELRARAEELSRSTGLPVSPGFDALTAKPARGIAEERNWTYLRKNGSAMPVRVSITALRNKAGDVTGYVVIASDLTERQAVERMKDEFISVVSHELRTPLTSIKGALGLVAGGVLQKSPERASRMLQIASENTDRLMRLVNDILDLERLQSGQLRLEKSYADSAELMKQAADSVRAMAESRGVTVEVSPVSQQLDIDAGRIVQSFTNLLGNAIKYSPADARVHFAAEVVGGSIVFKVTDQGRGIPAEKIESIFERFQQVDASDSREKGGTGLGLAITRSIVQRHYGEVWAESELGRGSTFFVRLPLVGMAVGAN